jgi:hypothetical protein
MWQKFDLECIMKSSQIINNDLCFLSYSTAEKLSNDYK